MTDTEVTLDDELLLEDTTPFWKKRRNHLALLVFIGFVIIYTLRFLLSVGIIGAYPKNKIYKFFIYLKFSNFFPTAMLEDTEIY